MTRYVITGATGPVGASVLDGLSTNDADEVVAVSRDLHAATEGVTWVKLDPADGGSLGRVVRDDTRVFLLPYGDPEVVAGAVSEAERVVLISSIGALTRPDRYAAAVSMESAIRATRVPFTVLHLSGLMSNALAWSESVRSAGVVAAPFADVQLPIVDPLDVGHAAARILADPTKPRETSLTLTGPDVVSPREQTQALAKAVGRPLTLDEQSREQALELMVRRVPAAVAEATLDVLNDPLPAETAVSTGVRQILGREPGSFAAWAHRRRAMFS